MASSSESDSLTAFERLGKSGEISVIEASESGKEFNINGKTLFYKVSENALLYHVIPHYRGNPGFFHLYEGTGECILLKSCYGDFIRVLKKPVTAEESVLSEIGRMLVKAETLLETLHTYTLIYSDGKILFAAADADTDPVKAVPDPHIPRPLTSAEYSDSVGGYLEDRTLFSRSLLATLLPDNITFLTASLLRKYPDIIHPFFLAFEAKVHSPSLKVIDGRAYVNISSLGHGFKEGKIDWETFARDYMPWQKGFKNKKPHKQELFISSQLPREELDEFAAEVDRLATSKGNFSFFEEGYFEPLIHMAMLGIMLNFLFQEQYLYLSRILEKNPVDILRIIYTTRPDSFFIKGAELNIPLYFEPSQENHEIKIEPSAAVQSKEHLLKQLSIFKRWNRKKAAFELLKAAHHTLDLRDKLLITAGAYHKKNRDILKGHADYLMKKGRFRTPDQVCLFDLPDLRRLVHDTYYTGLQPILEYRGSYASRVVAQVMPYELYEVDIPYAGMITEDQLIAAEEKSTFDCFSYNHKEMENLVVKLPEDRAECIPGNIYCGRTLPLAAIASLKAPAALLTGLAPAFSYAVEYALIHDIPLYTGLRFNELLLDGKTVRTGTDHITVVK